MDFIETSQAVLFIGFATAALSVFLEYTFMPGSIFAKYFEWLERMEKKFSESPFLWGFAPMFKPMGLCIYCLNVYVAVGGYIVLEVVAEPLVAENFGWVCSFFCSTFWGILTFAVSHVFLRVINKYLYKK